MQPFPYQRTPLRKLRDTRSAGILRALVVMATGLGKTVVAAFDVKSFLRGRRGGKVLYISHQADINDQALATFREVLGEDFSLAHFNGRSRVHPDVDVLFATFQLLATQRERFGPGEFAYIVVDESHHSHAETYRPTLEYFRPEFMLAITATPDRSDEQEITDIFGQPVFILPLETALARGLLCNVDYRLMTDEITNLKVLDTPVGRLSIAALNRTLFVPRRDEEIARLIQERVTQAGIESPRMVVFCTSVEHARRMAELLPGAEPVYASLGKKERRARLARFRNGETPIVTTVDLFNEGVDVPAANVIVFLRSTQSRTVFLQQLGRGLRRLLGKTSVLVLDFVANCDRLEMVAELWTRTRAIQHGSANRESEIEIPDNGILEVDFGTLEFTEVAKHILDVIGTVREGYTDEILLAHLSEHASVIGRSPTMEEFDQAGDEHGYASPATYQNRFGSWNGALQLAGLTQRMVRGKPQTQLIAELQSVGHALGRTPQVSDVKSASMAGRCSSVSIYVGEFGTWNAALKAAGFILNRKRGLSDDELLDELRRGAEILGHSPREDDLSALSLPSAQTYSRRFGSLTKAITAAGLTVGQRSRINIPAADLVLNLRQLGSELGRPPTRAEIDERSRQGKGPSSSAYYREYGSWPNALKAADL